MKILIIGVSGMLGSTMFCDLSNSHDVIGTARNGSCKRFFPGHLADKIITDVDVLDPVQLERILKRVQPEVVINCIGVIKQVTGADDPLIALPTNSMFPHRLARASRLLGTRVIHISTDCVFSGKKGQYLETDLFDANDLYGVSKFLGELKDYDNCVTVRTSIIGHGLVENKSLIDWFLGQTGTVQGYTRAIYSGLPTIELVRILKEFILPCAFLSGVYHVSSKPINKFNLLKLVKKEYGLSVEIEPDDQVFIDRSLDFSRFTNETGYEPKEWPILIKEMNEGWIKKQHV
ncbi:SDR family oxidoreductase [Planktomarina temperata]|nr:SDR family oxidoreductase [Planktomarina temperata]